MIANAMNTNGLALNSDRTYWRMWRDRAAAGAQRRQNQRAPYVQVSF